MPKRLTEIDLAEVSCVAAPANKGARTILFKHLAGPTAGGGPAGGGEGPAAAAPPADARVTKEQPMTDKTAADTAAREAAEKAQADAIAKAVADAVEKATAALKSQVEAAEKRAADAEAAAVAEKTARELVAMEKRAEAEIGRLPGTLAEKAQALAVIGKMDDATRATIEAMLKAGNEALAQLTAGGAVERGHSASAPAAGSALEKMQRAVAEIEKSEKVSNAKAWDLATARDPALYGEYLNEQRAARRAA